jgi:heterokaryon incompatibility protein (HET)
MTAISEKARAYQYQQLTGDRTIRLIRVEPSQKPQDPLRASLIPYRLGDVDFEAISYTWGEPKFTKVLHTPDGDLPITENIEAALKQFRQVHSPRLLWADAISIDQKNGLEKGSQVTLMGDIYGAAKTVLVWLGPLSLHTLWSMEYLLVLAEESDRFGISKPTGPARIWPNTPHLEGSQGDAPRILESAMLAHVESIYDRAWFTRLWIVQELVLAKKIVITCGPSQIDWVDFELATTLIIAAFDAVGGYPEVLKSVWRSWTLMEIRNKHQIATSGKFIEGDQYLSFDDFAGDIKSQECTDDRDRVYGLLSLTGAVKTMKPDYTKSVAEVYTEFATKNGGSGMLFDAGVCRRHPLSVDERIRIDPETEQIFANPHYLPSWVPDLRRRAPKEWRPIFGDYYNTSSSLRGRAFTSPDCPQMYFIHGLRFDTVESWVGLVGDDFNATANVVSFRYMTSMLAGFRKAILDEFETYPGDPVGGWSRNWPLALATSVPPDAPHPLESYLSTEDALVTDFALEVLWSSYETFAIAKDGEIRSKIDTLNLDVIPEDFADSLSTSARHVWDYHRYLCDVLASHMIIKTSRGFVGLAPSGIERGDSVVVFGGPSTPFVTRKVLDDESVNVLLGPCYLQGLMNAEIYGERYREMFEWMEVESGGVKFPIMKGLIGLV